MRGISWLAEELLASQEEQFWMELACHILHKHHGWGRRLYLQRIYFIYLL